MTYPVGDQNPGGGVASGCTNPIGHTGRCRDRYGRTWDNNHPPLYQKLHSRSIRNQLLRNRPPHNQRLRNRSMRNQLLRNRPPHNQPLHNRSMRNQLTHNRRMPPTVERRRRPSHNHHWLKLPTQVIQ